MKSKLKVDLKSDVERLIHAKDPFNRRLNNRNVERILSESKYRKR
jgi:hypothetical protein